MARKIKENETLEEVVVATEEQNVESLDNPILVSIDNGKMNMKARCRGKEYIYKNNIQKGKSKGGLLGKDTHNVTFYEIDYIVGDTATEKNREEGKARSEDIITTLTVITKFIEELNYQKKGLKFIVTYGESMNKYFSEKHQQFLRQQFVGEQKITRDGEEYEFEIVDLHVLPEGVGIVLEDLSLKKDVDDLYYITDIGGTTINFLKVVGLLPAKGECFSEKRGMTILKKKLVDFIKQNDVEINYDIVSKNLKKGGSLGNKKLDELKKRFGLEYVAKKIDEAWLSQDVNIKSMINYQPVYITGGGAEVFKDELEEYFRVGEDTVKIKEDAVWSNCRGFSIYGKYCLRLE